MQKLKTKMWEAQQSQLGSNFHPWIWILPMALYILGTTLFLCPFFLTNKAHKRTQIPPQVSHKHNYHIKPPFLS